MSTDAFFRSSISARIAIHSTQIDFPTSGGGGYSYCNTRVTNSKLQRSFVKVEQIVIRGYEYLIHCSGKSKILMAARVRDVVQYDDSCTHKHHLRHKPQQEVLTVRSDAQDLAILSAVITLCSTVQ